MAKRDEDKKKNVNPYDLNSLYRTDQSRKKATWLDWEEKPNPYDLSESKDRRNRC